ASSEAAAGRSESNASSHAETAGTFAQNAQTSASSASQSRQYAAASAQQADDSAREASGAREDAVAAAGVSSDQGGLASAAAARCYRDGFGDAVNQRVSAVEGLVDSKADTSLVNARPAFFSGVGEPVDVPNAVAGDYYFDTESGELHKITGV